MHERVMVIAEAGVNHNGSLALALEMIDAAADAGADVVKFQTFRAKDLVTAEAPRAGYQVRNTASQDSQLEMLRRLELSVDDHQVLVSRCATRGIAFMSTAFDLTSLRFLATLGMPAFKIPSGDVTAAPLLLEIARQRRPIIMSTGMCTLGEVEAALAVLAFGLLHDETPASEEDCRAVFSSAEGQAVLQRSVTLLHCSSEYPAPPGTVNLRAMETLRAAFGLPVGYSDHTEGLDISVAAVALGARVLEKHFTLDRALPGPDHAASLEPAELRRLVSSVRRVELALGSPLKAPSPEEVATARVARRSLVASRPVRGGEPISLDMLSAKRPGTGVSPMKVWSLVGRKAPRDFAPDELIDF